VKNIARWITKNKIFVILLLPGLLWIVFFFLIPLFLLLAISFGQKEAIIDISYEWNIQNYIRSIQGVYVITMLKSIIVSALTTITCLVIAIPVAFFISFSNKRIKFILLIAIMLPLWTNLLIRTYSLIAILRTKGHINGTIEYLWQTSYNIQNFFGLSEKKLIGEYYTPIELLHNNFSVIIGLFYIYVPFMIIPIYLVLEKFDKDMLEASYDLGASNSKTFLRVIIPNISPGIISGIILVFIPCMGSFIIPDLLGGTNSQMIGNIIERQFKSANDWPFGAALSFILLYITIILFSIRYIYAVFYSPSKTRRIY
tara:strand:+ start:13865 stop:14803 length:939 start_codon:yes stop_codon:yes gene_type:complete